MSGISSIFVGKNANLKLRSADIWIIFGASLVSVLFIFLVLAQEPAILKIKVGIFAAVLIAGITLSFLYFFHRRMRRVRVQLYQTLQVLENFDIDEPTSVKFEPSPYAAFNELNEYLSEMINRIRQHYQANKQFTANAAHELQTPLSVIKGHIELLLQSSRLGEKEIKTLGVILQNTNRLARLNSALILLSKIEHQRFSDFRKVNINRVTDEVLNNFQDLIKIQNLTVNKQYEDQLEVEMSATLAEIMVANLVQNAIRHNILDGWMNIVIKSDTFCVINSGKVLTVKPRALLKRFRRETNVEESLGLGLSIVQRICDHSELALDYQHEEGVHTLTIKF